MRKLLIILGIVTGIFAHLVSYAQNSPYDYRMGQISFVPGFGTTINNRDSVTNIFSLNILGGNQYAVHGAEIAGLFNLNQNNVSGAQAAGLLNKTGGRLSGAQVAGLSNINANSINGIQAAGLYNSVSGSLTGVQVSGLINRSSEKVLGAQVAGLINLSKDTQGAQISGLINKSDSVKGVQLAGLSNHTNQVKGTQIAGLINTADTTEGAQLSGLVNKAGQLNGFQLGIINIADSVGSGVQLGIINIVKKNGMFEFGLAYGDVIPWNLSLRTGTNQLYSILSVGSQFEGSQGDELWSYGLGFGSKLYLKDKVFTSLEVVAHELRKHQDDPETLNLLNRVQLNIGYQFFKHLSVTAGPVLNIYVAQTDPNNGDQPSYDIAKKPFHEHQEGNYKVQMWVGYSFSIRF